MDGYAFNNPPIYFEVRVKPRLRKRESEPLYHSSYSTHNKNLNEDATTKHMCSTSEPHNVNIPLSNFDTHFLSTNLPNYVKSVALRQKKGLALWTTCNQVTVTTIFYRCNII